MGSKSVFNIIRDVQKDLSHSAGSAAFLISDFWLEEGRTKAMSAMAYGLDSMQLEIWKKEGGREGGHCLRHYGF